VIRFNRLKNNRPHEPRHRANANVRKLLHARTDERERSPPIGIILCSDKSENVVKCTFPESGNPQIFTSKYKLYLPSETELLPELQAEKELIIRKRTLRESKKKNEIKDNVKTENKATKLETVLWDSTSKLIGLVLPHDYMNVCLGLIFLKYISHR
jgi:hypothetical protein